MTCILLVSNLPWSKLHISFWNQILHVILTLLYFFLLELDWFPEFIFIVDTRHWVHQKLLISIVGLIVMIDLPIKKFFSILMILSHLFDASNILGRFTHLFNLLHHQGSWRLVGLCPHEWWVRRHVSAITFFEAIERHVRGSKLLVKFLIYKLLPSRWKPSPLSFLRRDHTPVAISVWDVHWFG